VVCGFCSLASAALSKVDRAIEVLLSSAIGRRDLGCGDCEFVGMPASL